VGGQSKRNIARIIEKKAKPEYTGKVIALRSKACYNHQKLKETKKY